MSEVWDRQRRRRSVRLSRDRRVSLVDACTLVLSARDAAEPFPRADVRVVDGAAAHEERYVDPATAMRLSLGRIVNANRRRRAYTLIGSSVPTGMLWCICVSWIIEDDQGWFGCVGGLLIAGALLISGLVLLRIARYVDEEVGSKNAQ